MGSWCCKFKEEGAGKCARVGREEEGTSSNRPELGGIVLALQSATPSEDALLLCDNEAVFFFVCYQEMGGTRRKSNISYIAIH
jgi:ribonuclease HI